MSAGSANPSARFHIARLPFLVACAITFFFIASWAWVSDDAYITFRVVDNAVHGFGLRWNIDERVQAYTHPLWMLLHIPLYFFWRNIFLLTIILSAALAAGSVALLMRTVEASRLHKILLILVPLALDKAYRNHIINGLEAPLMLFLLAWFWHDFYRAPQLLYRQLFICSLILLTRLDGIVVIFLPMLWRIVNTRFRDLSVTRALAAGSPLLGWFTFALWYYGFILPNTKYAKLNTGLGNNIYTAQGWAYYNEFKIFDRFGYLFMCFALCCAIGGVLSHMLSRLRNRPPCQEAWVNAFLMAASIVLHVAYVIRIGGDFMDGRFFVTPFFLAVMLVYFTLSHIRPRLLLVLVIGMGSVAFNRYNYDHSHPYVSRSGIYDERHFYAWKQALFKSGGFISNTLNGKLFANPESVMRSIPAGTTNRRNYTQPPHWEDQRKVNQTGYIGLRGYTEGPYSIIVDSLGLAEPLLARLPIIKSKWHVGHYLRHIPGGYMYARRTGDTSEMHPSLAQYYEKLHLVTSGNLLDPERLSTILGFQTGTYEPLKKAYINATQ